MYLKTLPSWVFCYFVLFYSNWSYFKFLKLVTIESPQACLHFSFILSLIHTHIKLSHTHTHSPFVHTQELLGTSKVKGRSVYTSTDVKNSFINTNTYIDTHISFYFHNWSVSYILVTHSPVSVSDDAQTVTCCRERKRCASMFLCVR